MFPFSRKNVLLRVKLFHGDRERRVKVKVNESKLE